MPNPTPVIDAAKVELTLPSTAGEVRILRGLDFMLAPGESVGVVGRSGSGKSSLLSVLAGLERPTGGRVVVAGCDLTVLDEDALARFRRDHIGVVFQSFHLIPTMTALENAALPLELAGRRDAFEAAGALLASVGLADRLGHYPDQLSGGEQQRVAIARAVAARPPILFADEPTGNLDAAAGARIADILFELQETSGSALVLVTHDETLARRCGRVLTMQDGRFLGDGAHAAKAAE